MRPATSDVAGTQGSVLEANAVAHCQMLGLTEQGIHEGSRVKVYMLWVKILLSPAFGLKTCRSGLFRCDGTNTMLVPSQKKLEPPVPQLPSGCCCCCPWDN